MDPSIQPRVIYSYPPAGGIGPFNVYAPPVNSCYLNDYSYCNVPGHFFLQFNKMIMSATMVSPNIRVTGGSRPLNVRLRGSSPLPLQNVFECVVYQSSNEYGAERYEVGKTYTVIVDTGIVDGTGNHLVTPFSFSFMPEPRFRILHTLPAGGDSIAANGRVLVRLNSTVDSSFIAGIHFLPPVPGRWYFNDGNDSTLLAFYPTNGFFQESAYTLTIADGVHDKSGNMISGKTDLSFRTYPFHVVSAYPENGEKLYNLSSTINIAFSGPVDPSSIGYGMDVSPYTPDMAVSGNYIYRNTNDHDLIPSTYYSIRVNANLRSTDNTLLGTSYAFGFFTPAFGLQYSSPSTGQINVSRGSSVTLNYSGRIDTSSIVSSFSIDPQVHGHLIWGSYVPSSFTFSPDDFYASGTKYTVIIQPTIRSIDGYHPAKADTTYFTVVQ